MSITSLNKKEHLSEEKKWYVAKAPYMTSSVKEQISSLSVETFIPLLTTIEKGKSKKYTLNYIFIHGTKSEIEEEISNIPKIYLLYHRPGVSPGKSYAGYERKPMVVTDKEMKMFIQVVSLYQNGAPIVDIPTHELQKGDVVRIIGGPFEGVEGTLITRKGKKGGKVVVSVSHLVSVTTLDVEPEDIKVISFADEKKHLYKLMDSYLPRIENVWNNYLTGNNSTEKDLNDMRLFINNYEVKTSTINTEAKLLTLRFMAYVSLGLTEHANELFKQLDNMLNSSLKSEKIKQFVKTKLNQYTELNGKGY